MRSNSLLPQLNVRKLKEEMRVQQNLSAQRKCSLAYVKYVDFFMFYVRNQLYCDIFAMYLPSVRIIIIVVIGIVIAI